MCYIEISSHQFKGPIVEVVTLPIIPFPFSDAGFNSSLWHIFTQLNIGSLTQIFSPLRARISSPVSATAHQIFEGRTISIEEINMAFVITNAIK